ncbi:MAG: hypothetical protein JXR42_04630 [Gammaproteobacteria bacterium]|nr:hypothetical protein [Gammaproteobacteria bacterium]
MSKRTTSKTIALALTCGLLISQFALADSWGEEYLTQASVFSRIAYDAWQHPSVPLPTGWSYYVKPSSDVLKQGYYAESFINKKDPSHIIIEVAQRGSSNAFDDINDFEIMLGLVPYQYNYALKYDIAVRKYAENEYPSASIEYRYTGHSLGAALAELIVAKEYSHNLTDEHSVVFETPGVKPIIQKMIIKGLLNNNAYNNVSMAITHVFDRADAINTCNEQIKTNRTYVFTDSHEVFSSIPTSTLGSPGVIYYFKNYSLHQHRLMTMYNYIHSHSQYSPTTNFDNWPVGFAAAYKYYLNYSAYKDYWQLYMAYAWVHDTSLQKKYGDYENYRKSFIEKLDQEHGELNLQNDGNSQQETLNKPITPITSSKSPTLYDVINNNYDGKSWLRRKIFANANDNKKLYWAVMCGDIDFAKKLIAKGGLNLSAQHGTNHLSLVQIAIEYDHPHMAKLLLANGANKTN